MPQPEESKKAIASVINNAIDAVLKNGPVEEILQNAERTIAQTLHEHTVTPGEAVKAPIRYYQDAYKQVISHKGLPVMAVAGDEGGEANPVVLYDFSDKAFRKLQPELDEALQRCIDQVQSAVEPYQRSEIDEGLAEFVQWSQTVPFGGTKDKTYRTEARSVRSSLKSTASWHKRFFVIHSPDFYAFAEHIIACHSDQILAGKWKWSSSTGCDQHRDLDGKVYYKRNSWALQKGLIQVPDSDYFDNNPVPGSNGCMCCYEYIDNLHDLPSSALIGADRQHATQRHTQGSSVMEAQHKPSWKKAPWWKRIFKSHH